MGVNLLQVKDTIPTMPLNTKIYHRQLRANILHKNTLDTENTKCYKNLTSQNII